MNKTVDLFEEHAYAVNLSHTDPGDLGRGELRFGANKWPHVDLEDSTKTRDLADGTMWPIVKAKTDDGISFTLFECAIRGHSFYADYVVLGDVQPEDIQKITIRYAEVTEWLANRQRIEGQPGDKLTWSNNPKPIAVNVPSEQMTISTKHVAYMVRKGEDHILHQHIEFVVEKIGGAFTLEDVQRTTLDISRLFSILLAHPVSLLNVSVVPLRGSPQQIYFTGFHKFEKSLSNNGRMNKCFIQAEDIEDRWQTIFENYYKSPIRTLIWARLSGMQRYDSFWEYEALGYIALLDQYGKRVTEGTKKHTALSEKKLAAVEKEVERVAPAVVGEQRKNLVNAIGAVLHGSRELNFAERFEQTVNATDADIAKIVGLAGEPFKVIKNLRDDISHGDDPKHDGKDYTRITAIIAKIEILLTYWAFMDFGLTKADFLKCLTTTHSRLRRVSQLDEVHLNRVTGSAEFFTVSEDKFREIAETKNILINPCFVVDANGELHHSEHYRTIYRDWAKASNTNSSASFGDIFGVPADAVRHSGKVYIESAGAKPLLLYAVFLFDATKLPTV